MVVRVDLNISLDGFATTTDQSPEEPFGKDWPRLVGAYVATRTFRERVLHDSTGKGTTGVDDLRPGLFRGDRGGDHGRRHVRSAQFSGRCGLERVVGRRAAIPLPRLRSHPHIPAFTGYGGRHAISLHKGQPHRSIGARHRSGGWQGCAHRWRTDRRKGFPAGRIGGPAACGHNTDLLGRGIRLWDDLRGLENGYSVRSETAESGVVHLTFSR